MPNDRKYIPGTFYRMDERTGFKTRSFDTRKEWTGRYVREVSWEPRNAQDFVRGTHDEQRVHQPRPRGTDSFLGPLITSLTADIGVGGDTIPVLTSVRMEPGDAVQIMLSNGEMQRATLLSIVDETTVLLDRGLIWPAASGAEFVDLLYAGSLAAGVTPPVSNWILATGSWSDTGVWIDTEVWID